MSFRRLAWSVVGLAFPVIAWGAVVRATGSGAGCGNTWPTCDGELLPLASSTEQLIELSHRLSSGVFGLVVVALAVAARRSFPPGHTVRKLAWLTLTLTGVEALLGAGLVRFEQVADNAEVSRAFWISGHLVNTMLLLAAAFATAWFATHADRRYERTPRTLVTGAVALLIVGMSGAITALGDTLFPAASFVEGLRSELSVTASVFERLRVAHPILAVATAVGIILLVRARGLAVGSSPAEDVAGRGAANRTGGGRTLVLVLSLQLAIGVVNVLLAAPIWMQVVHLLVADLVWVIYLRVVLEESTVSAPIVSMSAR
ncbi:MAG: heme A synthase [Acidimicrobiia bacterium]|nr:heme A synthase [Acidimicrobiia bacterium]